MLAQVVFFDGDPKLVWFRVRNIYLTIVKDLHYNVGAKQQNFGP